MIDSSLAPMVLNISIDMAAYNDVKQQFLNSWKHPGQKPAVVRVWKIYNSKKHHDAFSQYRLEVERRIGSSGGNSKLRWHGTLRACRLGDVDRERVCCSIPYCSLCGIIKSSFQIVHSTRRFNYGRFGKGIYTSATSSKADSYVKQTGVSPNRAVLLNDVVIGKTQKLTVDNPNLTAPPAGFDSVTGEPGGSLNYDECIVYKLPSE